MGERYIINKYVTNMFKYKSMVVLVVSSGMPPPSIGTTEQNVGSESHVVRPHIHRCLQNLRGRGQQTWFSRISDSLAGTGVVVLGLTKNSEQMGF